MKKYSEVRIDYYDAENEVWTVDAWKTSDMNEDGRVVAYITDNKKVLYCDPEARCCEVVQKAIKEKLASMHQEFFNVLRVSRDDVECAGYKGSDLTDEQMEQIAYRMHNNNDCIMDAYWEALRQACEHEDIKATSSERDPMLDYVKSHLECWQIMKCRQEYYNREPMSSDIVNLVHDLCEEYGADNDLPEEWWLEQYDDEEEVILNL